jgi:hypothetical protein
MNERIKQLAEQAGYLPDSFGIGHWDMPECKKFAELIILECAKVCDDVASDSHGDWRGGAWECETGIKEHFGVE